MNLHLLIILSLFCGGTMSESAVKMENGQPEMEMNLPNAEYRASDGMDGHFGRGSYSFLENPRENRYVLYPFPEIDYRGFHESVFDNEDASLYPYTRGKKAFVYANPASQTNQVEDFVFAPRLRDLLYPPSSYDFPGKRGRSGFINWGDNYYGMFDGSSSLKRKMGAELNGDAFYGGFGAFDTLRKRARGQEFNGDAFHSNFGDFKTMKRARGQEFNGDAFDRGFGAFETLKKRIPWGKRLNHLGGDAFYSGFGKFETLRKRSGGYGGGKNEKKDLNSAKGD